MMQWNFIVAISICFVLAACLVSWFIETYREMKNDIDMWIDEE